MASNKRKQVPKKRKKKKAASKKISFALNKEDLLPLAGILLLTALCYLRVAGYDFVNWDDDRNITENPNLRHFDWYNIKGIFTTPVIGNYNPLPIFTFAVEKHLFGLDPGVFHTTNLVLHLLCTFLVYRFTRLTGLPVWGAAIAAAIFGLHPMRIESVAWITERKDVLFGAFYLLAMNAYVKYVRSGKNPKYLIALLLFFVLSLFSKIQAVALPLSLLAIDYLLKRPLKWSLLFSKWYLFGLSLIFGLLGIYFLRDQGSLDTSQELYNWGERFLIGIYSYVIYIVKFLAPYRISPLYPYPPDLPWFAYVTPLILAGIVAGTWLAHRKQQAPLVFGVLFFTFNVVFVLQIVGAGQGFLADRFTYIPYIGLIYIVVFYGLKLYNLRPGLKGVVLGIAILWLAFLTFQTWRHVPIWKDSGTLWSHVLKYYDKTPLPYRNRAQFYRDNGQINKALQDYANSIALKKDPDVVNSRARLYFDRQMWQEALKDYDLAIELDPTSGEFYINRGAVYANLGNMQRALQDMSKGVELQPDFPNGYKNRSLVYQALGQNQNALNDLERYLQLNPYDPDIWYETARLYRALNNPSKALNALNRALELNNSKGIYWLERARTHYSLGNKPAARNDLKQAEALGAQVDQRTRQAIMQ